MNRRINRCEFIGGMGAVLLCGCGMQEPGADLSDNLDKDTNVDPPLVRFKETARISTGLDGLKSMDAGPGGRIYVVGRNALAVFNLDGHELERFQIDGTPDCLAIAPDGDLLLGLRDHVEVITASGERKSVWRTLGDKAYITSIAVNADEVYVADAGNRIVLRFSRDGTLLGRIGEADPERDIPGFIVPSPYFDVAFDDEGSLWVTNPGRHGLEQYRSNGDLVTSWYKPSMQVEGFCGCCNPTHIAFRADGSLVTCEKGLVRVKLYDAMWTFDALVTEPDLFTDSPEELVAFMGHMPVQDIAVDERNRILVLDSELSVVRVFDEKEDV